MLDKVPQYQENGDENKPTINFSNFRSPIDEIELHLIKQKTHCLVDTIKDQLRMFQRNFKQTIGAYYN